MKKKRQHLVQESKPEIELKSLIHQQSLFFDKLVDLIPAKFYLPTDDDEKPWVPGFSKKEKDLAKKESKENIKKLRRDRLDPGKSAKTTLELLMEKLDNEKLKEDSDHEEVEINPMMSGMEEEEEEEEDDKERAVTYEELRQRLHRKIEELRAGRNTTGSDKIKKKKKEIQEKKRKRESGLEDKKGTMATSSEKRGKDVEEATKELKFSHVKIGDKEDHGKKKKKRKLSKLEELQKVKELEEAKKDPDKGDTVSKKHSWKAATSRAAGNKVHDNPKLLKHSIEKEKKRHQKNVEKWKERVETQQKMKEEKQQKRSRNIAERIHQRKMRRIAKREKKLLRAGFEGRKDSYINEDST